MESNEAEINSKANYFGALTANNIILMIAAIISSIGITFSLFLINYENKIKEKFLAEVVHINKIDRLESRADFYLNSCHTKGIPVFTSCTNKVLGVLHSAKKDILLNMGGPHKFYAENFLDCSRDENLCMMTAVQKAELISPEFKEEVVSVFKEFGHI